MPSISTDPGGDPQPAAGARRTRIRGVLLGLLLAAVTTLVVCLLVEGFASTALSASRAMRALEMKEESHVRHDAQLGWSHRPDVHLQDFYGPGASFTTNSQGFRAKANFVRQVPAGRFRIVALGDSFTLGYGVGDGSSYPARMEALCPALQTVNMGQGGYGADQAYLWYKRDGMKLDADMLLFAIVAHDIYRMASDNFIGYGKPVLRVRDNALVVDNVPPPDWKLRRVTYRSREFLEGLAAVRLARSVVRRLRPEEAFYGMVSDSVRAAAELAFDELGRLARDRGQRYVVAYLPSSDLLAKEPTREATWLEDYARRKGVPFINLVPEFNRLSPAQLARMFRWDYHYTEEGNSLVAAALLQRLHGQVGGFPACAPLAGR